MGVTVGPALVAAVVVLVAAAAAVVRYFSFAVTRDVVVASARAVGQLAAVSLILAAVLESGWSTAAFIGLMLTVAAATSGRRVAGGISWGRWTAAPIAVGALPVLAIVLATGAVPLTTIAVLPVAGILIGGAMTATSLAGRRSVDELRNRHGEYEAALALGFTPRSAALELCRPVAAQSLVPALDQTRTVGLVTLPGAFVGVLLGGGSPAQAGAVQLLVLVGLLLAEAIAAVLMVELIAAGRLPTSGGTPAGGRARPGRRTG
ncbi:ABC transporter permease [Virgisporangium aurantiacum]|uniref:ABC transporter permease n=1 Tax=Virgisporangium aurantiacum TaxID=175570 RepID=A0A8J3Z5K6_9ACTN|nr:ABC transporter permease [Virgisporangium aurantiacum]GIJ57826.1 ABC transporter permease [Virgisporangium aurantiacum]